MNCLCFLIGGYIVIICLLQLGQALTAKIIWENLEKNFPEVIGPVNPNNDKIQQIFGDQGGY